MKITRKFDRVLVLLIAVTTIFVFASFIKASAARTYADGDESKAYTIDDAKYVTFFDDGEKLTVKTDAATVEEALKRANITLSSGDIVEPGLEADIDNDNYFINIHRARPVIIKDGLTEKYFMSASYDAKTIATEAGLTIYDGDQIKPTANNNFLETGVAELYTITRNGGQTITIEEEIPFTEQVIKDYNLAPGTREIKSLGEVGTKRNTYQVYYIDNVEVSRELISEEIIRQPAPRIVAEGARPSIRPDQETCANWAREAGVSESDLEAALAIIYHESGCRVTATNSSSGAYGIPQALPGTKMASAGADWQTNPVTQIRWMSNYVNRYGGWKGAWSFWVAHHWY